MLAPTHFRRSLLHAQADASATTSSSTEPAPVASTLDAVLRTARAACAVLCDALHSALNGLARLFQQATATPTTPSTATATPMTPSTTPTPTTRSTAMASTTPQPTTAASSAQSTATTARSARSATSTSSAPQPATHSTSGTATATATTRPRTTTRRPRRLRDPMIAHSRRRIARDFARAHEPQSIASAMRSNASPPPPPLEQLDREALLFPANRPHHDYFADVVDGAPEVRLTPELARPFDAFLLPPLARADTPEEQRERVHFYNTTRTMQASLAQARINLAVVRARGSPPPTTDSSFSCACGCCPNGTAAYPLCVALTMRRTMQSFGKRATMSHASDTARRQSATGHRRSTIAALTTGVRVRG